MCQTTDKTSQPLKARKEPPTLYHNLMKSFLILNRLCNLLNGRTKKQIIWMFEASGDAITGSMFEKILRSLRENFDAPIVFDYKTKTYTLVNYDFKKFILDSF